MNAFYLIFLAKYVIVFCNSCGPTQLREIRLATTPLFCICVSVEVHIPPEDFVNFVIRRPGKNGNNRDIGLRLHSIYNGILRKRYESGATGKKI